MYIGTGCKPINLFYPPGYKAGNTVKTAVTPSFKPSVAPILKAGQSLKPMKPVKQPSAAPTLLPPPVLAPVIKPTHNPHTHYPTV